jgi:hypothetical protein
MYKHFFAFYYTLMTEHRVLFSQGVIGFCGMAEA